MDSGWRHPSGDSEEAELVQQSLRSGDDRACLVDGVGGFFDGRVVAGAFGVLQLIAPPTQRPDLTEARSELSADRLLDREVPALGRRPQTLMGKEPSDGLASGVIGEHEGRVWVALDC